MRTVDLFRFLLYCAAGFMAALLVMLGLTYWGDSLSRSCLLQSIQWGQTLCLMILPPLLWTRFRLRQPVWSTLRLNRSGGHHLFLVVVLMLVAAPLLEWIAQFNDALPLPEALEGPLRASGEASNLALHDMIDNGNGWWSWASLILLISVGTAVGEELMFRGALLNLMLTSRWSRHAVAWMVGFVFSAIHFDLFGFLPRWLLGTLFVYLVYASRSLWPAIVAHAVNNLIALIEVKSGCDASSSPLAQQPWVVGCSALLTALLLWGVVLKPQGKEA